MLLSSRTKGENIMIIHNLLQPKQPYDKQYAEILTQCLNFKELDIYLKNLDIQAKVYQQNEINAYGEHQISETELTNEKISRILSCKILNILERSNLDAKSLESYFEQLHTILYNDIDIADMNKTEARLVSKLCLITKISMDNMSKLYQQKNSIAL